MSLRIARWSLGPIRRSMRTAIAVPESWRVVASRAFRSPPHPALSPLKRRPFKSRMPAFIRQVGPGIVTGAADDDPSGIATYTQAGAQFGTHVLWTMFLTVPFMVAIQLVSARIGRQSGRGIVANLRLHAPGWFVGGIVSLLLVANT